jgi:hypothetical protein
MTDNEQFGSFAPRRCRADAAPHARAPFPLRVDRFAGLEHCYELRESPHTRLGLLGVLEAVKDRVAVLATELREERLGLWASVELALEIIGDGDPLLALVGCLPAPIRLRALDCGSPAGRILPEAISSSAFSRLMRDHLLRGCRGVNRWRKYRSSRASRRPSIHPKQSALSSTSG